MSSILKDRSFRLSIILTLIFLGTGVVFLMAGLADYSWVLFVLLPIVLGLAIGALPNRKYAIYGAVITTIIVLLSLFIPGYAGLLCVGMAIGLILPILFLVLVIIKLVKSYRQIKSTERLSILLLPLLPFMIAAPAENFLNTEKEEVMSVKTEQVFNYTPEQVYDAIKSVDKLDAAKPFLMYLDLPVPVKCVLEKEEVGGLRTCYFDAGNFSNADFGSGVITERITELERGKVLKMDVIDYNLVGRNWLGFNEAIYYFEKVGDGQCKMTRITTYTSVLTPRFYWEPLERLGIEQEHEYVFRNLENDLGRMFGKK